MIHVLENAGRLRELRAAAGDMAQLADAAGQRLYRWDEESRRPDNGGTVLGSGEKGRWLLCHSGTVELSVFGVTGPQTPMDDALDALVNDPAVRCIRICSDVRMTRRHTFFRSGLTLDFGGCCLSAQGVAPAVHNDPFHALLHFCGRPDPSRAFTVTLTAEIPELYDILEVADSEACPVRSWWRVAVNNLRGREERELDKLLQVTEIVDATHVRVNYKLGWPLAAGRKLTWTPVEPVEDVRIENMRFLGNSGGEETGVHPICFQYAVRCDARDIHAEGTYWPVILRQHCTEYVTQRCSLRNPIEVVVGGTGYLTQQICCLYGRVQDCTASNARHLNDFTQSAYCMVDNCHADGDYHGAFVTHGQFEHDLTYVGCSGLLSFANSGPTWGGCAKRITVERHVGCWSIGFTKISDLTLRDVTICKTEKYDQCGVFQQNVDGLQMQGCSGDELILTQRSRRSRRPTVIRDCWFRRGVTIVRQGPDAVAADTPLVLENILTQEAQQ